MLKCTARDRPAISEADLRVVDEISDALWAPVDEGLREILARKVAARVREACQETSLDRPKPL